MKKSARKIERESSRPQLNPKKFRVSVIGAGRMGTTLGRALHRLGYSVELVVTRHASTSRRAAKLVNGEATTMDQLSRLDASRERLFASNFLLISTPDDALAAVADQLSTLFQAQKGTNNGKVRRRIALHTSGALSSDVLAPLRVAGFAVASLHPLISIADLKSDQKIFRGTYFCIEGDREAARVARAIVRELGGNSFTVAPKSKALYHAAAVMSSGHVTALFDLAVEMLKRCGLPERRARQVLLPLLKSASDNLQSKGSAQALTGPFARGDAKTAEKHLAALESAGMDAALAAYVVLGRHSLDLARRLHRGSGDFDQISRLLSRSRK
jgi:predicted short-subunit dehydrogenase-like oxidoreductase (DUF2520 family)